MPRKAKKPAEPRPTASPTLAASSPDQAQTVAAASEPANDQRDPQGRYAKGNSGGPGNPHARHCARMLEMFRNTITDEHMSELCHVLYERAVGGDMSAIKMIWQYKIGKPLPAPHPDMLDRDEWDHFQKDAMTLDELKRVLCEYPSRIGNTIASAALPSITSTISRNLAAKLIESLPPEYLAQRESASSPDQQTQPAENPLAQSGSLATTEEHPIPNGFLPALDANGLPVRQAYHTPSAKHSRPISNGDLTAQQEEQVALPRSLPPRQTSPATPASPISNGKSKTAQKGKKNRKPLPKQWLAPIAKKCQAATTRKRERAFA